MAFNKFLFGSIFASVGHNYLRNVYEYAVQRITHNESV